MARWNPLRCSFGINRLCVHPASLAEPVRHVPASFAEMPRPPATRSETGAEMEPAAAPVIDDGKIGCLICEARIHSVQAHLKDAHPSISIEDYKAQNPDAPLMSEKAKALLQQKAADRVTAAPSAMPTSFLIKRFVVFLPMSFFLLCF